MLPVLLAVIALGGSSAAWITRTTFEERLSRAYPEGTGRASASWPEARQAWLADASLDVAVAQLLLGIFGVVGVAATVFYARLAWREAQRSADAAHEALADARVGAREQSERFTRQLGAAQASADAASRMADALAASERAYVFLGGTRVFDGNPKKRLLIWHNYGKTPALLTKIQFACSASDPFPNPKETMGLPMPSNTIISAGGDLELGIANIDLAEQTQLEGQTIYLFGQITYKDVHQIERHSWFCQMLGTNGFFPGLLYQDELNGFD